MQQTALQVEVLFGEERVRIVLGNSSGRDQIQLDGRDLTCDWIRLADGQYSLIIGGRVYELAVEFSAEVCTVSGRGGKLQMQVLDPRRFDAQRTSESAQPGLQRIHAEMPGKVVRLLCRVGDGVLLDQALVVIEAMKMQNEIRAPKRGVITEIAVEEGKAVSSGDFILSLE